MSRKLIFILLLLLAGSVALGQGTPVPPPKPDQGQKKPDSDPALGAVTSGGLNQNVVPASDLSNNEWLCLNYPVITGILRQTAHL